LLSSPLYLIVAKFSPTRFGKIKSSLELSHVPSPTCRVFEEYEVLPGGASCGAGDIVCHSSVPSSNRRVAAGVQRRKPPCSTEDCTMGRFASSSVALIPVRGRCDIKGMCTRGIPTTTGGWVRRVDGSGLICGRGRI
jgi:hypothetical protein